MNSEVDRTLGEFAGVYVHRRYEWMQNAEKLFITFFVKSLEDSDVTVDISSQSLKVQIRNPSINKEAAEDQQQIFVFHVPKLRHEIRPEDSTYEIHKVSDRFIPITPPS